MDMTNRDSLTAGAAADVVTALLSTPEGAVSAVAGGTAVARKAGDVAIKALDAAQNMYRDRQETRRAEIDTRRGN